MATPSGKPSRKSDLEGDERAWVESFGRSLRTDENVSLSFISTNLIFQANATASLNQHRAPGAFSTFIPVSNTTNFGWLGSSSTGLASPTDSSIPCPPVSAQARRASIPQQVGSNFQSFISSGYNYSVSKRSQKCEWPCHAKITASEKPR